MNRWKWIRERKRHFREHAVPVFRIGHTRSFEVDGESYQLFGQKTTDSRIFTNYQVFDSEGNEATKQIGEEIYTYVTKLQLLTEIIFLKELIEKQAAAQKNKRAQSLINQFEKQSGEKLKRLFATNRTLEKLLFTANEKLSSANEQEELWGVRELQELTSYWERVRKIYETRIPQLQSFYQFIHSRQLTDEKLPKGLDQLYEEAEEIQKIFYEAIQIDPSHLKNLNEFITLNGKLGLVNETEEEQNVLTMWEKLSHILLGRLIYIPVFVLALIVFTGFSGYQLNMLTGMGIGYLFLISVLVHFIRNATLKRNMRMRITQKRTRRAKDDQSLLKKLKQAYEVSNEVSGTSAGEVKKASRNKTSLNRWSLILMVVGGVISAFTLITYQSPLDWMLIMFGIVIVIIGWLLPRLQNIKKKLEERN